MSQRLVDVLVSLVALVVLAPLLAVLAILVRLDSPGPVLFRQQRVGRHFRPFAIVKLRTMVPDAAGRGAAITAGGDSRVTRVGRVLRAAKLDELPQFWNVLKGDMSIVGPRPEVPRYVEQFRTDFEEILRVRPGITDLASVVYRHEEDVLARAADPEAAYVAEVLPAKLELARDYVRRRSLRLDLAIIGRTVLALFDRRRPTDDT